MLTSTENSLKYICIERKTKNSIKISLGICSSIKKNYLVTQTFDSTLLISDHLLGTRRKLTSVPPLMGKIIWWQ